jgi:hypothetical protein
MTFTPAFQNVLYFMHAWKIASKLMSYLECMNIPNYRMNSVELHNLLWLARNLHIGNKDHHLYEEARRLIGDLLGDSRYRALKWETWRST